MMNVDDFKNSLDAYGTDIDRWPADIREDAMKSLASSVKFQKILEEEKLLEKTLSLREFEEPSANLESRILKASMQSETERKTQTASFYNFLNSIFSSIHIPNPAFALTMILVIGITLGYLGNTSGSETISSEDLHASEINFYDGDFYE